MTLLAIEVIADSLFLLYFREILSVGPYLVFVFHFISIYLGWLTIYVHTQKSLWDSSSWDQVFTLLIMFYGKLDKTSSFIIVINFSIIVSTMYSGMFLIYGLLHVTTSPTLSEVIIFLSFVIETLKVIVFVVLLVRILR